MCTYYVWEIIFSQDLLVNHCGYCFTDQIRDARVRDLKIGMFLGCKRYIVAQLYQIKFVT
jgi:hypothetical protein